MLRGACTPGPVRQRVVPYLLYEDAGAAMDWLIRAFGFTERARDQQSDGTARHGELLTGNGGVIMLGSRARVSGTCQARRGNPAAVHHDQLDLGNGAEPRHPRGPRRT